MKWEIEYDNDTGWKDESFREWWTVKKGDTAFTAYRHDDAIFLCDKLNDEPQQEVNDINWTELRNRFYDECTKKDGRMIKIDLAPHDLFEWFKNKIFPQQKEQEIKSKEEWISVEERLPEKSTVDVYTKGGYRLADIDYRNGVHEENPSFWCYAHTDNGRRWVDISDDITHWMPLPKPPKQGITTPASNTTQPWKIEYDNDTGPSDESFRQWWTVSNGSMSFTCTSEKEAQFLKSTLNKQP